MTRKQEVSSKGSPAHRRTEADYMSAMLDVVSLEDWREVVGAALGLAKDGDASARAWLAQYLIGKAAGIAPTGMAVVVQQLTGTDPLLEALVKKHVDQEVFPSFNEKLEDRLRGAITQQLDALDTEARRAAKSGPSPDGSAESKDTAA